MATDFVGTNTEKVDRLVGAMVEMRTTVRLCLAAVGLGMPLVIGLITFLVVQSFSASAKFDRVGDRLDGLEKKVERLEQKLDRIAERLDRMEMKGGKP